MYRLTYRPIRIINGYAIGENFKICIQPRPKTSVIRYETTRSLSVPSLRPTKRSAGSNGDALIHSTIKLMQICRLLIHYSRGIVIEERSIVIVEYHRFSKKPLVVTEREKEWGRGREREDRWKLVKGWAIILWRSIHGVEPCLWLKRYYAMMTQPTWIAMKTATELQRRPFIVG